MIDIGDYCGRREILFASKIINIGRCQRNVSDKHDASNNARYQL
jgi:hypothetical protein